MSRVYADANAIRGESWYEYDKIRVEWSSPDRYEIVRRLGGGRYSQVRALLKSATASIPIVVLAGL
jgi:casein kinase II subunit alpha